MASKTLKLFLIFLGLLSCATTLKNRDASRKLIPPHVDDDGRGRKLTNLEPKKTREDILSAYAKGQRDFSGWNLGEADLSEANLSYTNLQGANLSYTNLYKADLSYTKLSEASFYEADLREANLIEAFLYLADLGGADLREAKLRRAILFGAEFYNKTDLRGADLRGADLTSPTKYYFHSISVFDAKVKGAYYDSGTVFPLLFYPRFRGMILLEEGKDDHYP